MKPLAERRIEAGVSQGEAARIYGCTQQFISACERGLRKMNPRDEARLRAALEAAAAEREARELDLVVGRAVLKSNLLFSKAG